MGKVCPTDKTHLHFLTDVQVAQIWYVDGDGNWVHTFDECVEVVTIDKEDLTCVECGAEAVEPTPTHVEAWLAARAAEWEKEQYRGYPLPPSKEVMEAWKKAFDALTEAGLKLAKIRDEGEK
jgi:hypothetical protein